MTSILRGIKQIDTSLVISEQTDKMNPEYDYKFWDEMTPKERMSSANYGRGVTVYNEKTKKYSTKFPVLKNQQIQEAISINDDDWYEIDPSTNTVIKQRGPQAFRAPFGQREIKLPNGNIVMRGISLKMSGLDKELKFKQDNLDEEEQQLEEDLRKWFKEKWVRFGPDGEIRGDCARGDDSEGKPKCLPQSKAQSLGKKGRASAAARKRREDPNPERSGKAINVNTKKKSNEGVAEGLVGDVVVHNYTKIPIDLEPGQAQIAGWGPNDEPLYRVKGQDGKEVKTWSKRRMLTIAKEQGVAEAINPDITNPAFSHQQQIGDYLYVARYWSKGLKITAYHGNKQIGYAELMYQSAPFDDFADPKTTPKRIWLESEWTKVDPKYQRQGIMSTMYAYAKMLGNSVKPSQTRSDDAKAAWKSWRDAGDAQHLTREGVAEAFGPLPKDNQQIRLGRHTVDIERVGLDNDYISFAWHDSQGQEHYEEVQVGDLGSYDDLIKKIKQEISYQERQYTDQGVAEGKVINTYLWHGSRQKIPMLEPRQSVDTGGAAGSNQNAIYATSDPKVAIAMGLTTAGSDTGMFPNDPQMVLFSGKIRKGEYVYLHKLPFNGPDGKPQFVQGGNSREFHSIPGVEGIKPIEIKEIPVNKYLNLIRKATPADLKLRKKYMKEQGVAEAERQPGRFSGAWQILVNGKKVHSFRGNFDQETADRVGVVKATSRGLYNPGSGDKIKIVPVMLDQKQGVAEGSSNDMSTEDMIAYLRQHHDKNLHQDYLNHLTSTNSKFVLKNIPLTSIRTELSGLDRAKVEQYKQMDFSKAPPIVIGSDGNILDGYHRATVAKALGIPTIKAYVGVKGQQSVAEGSNAPYWRVEQSEATGRYYVVTGYTDKSRKVWKNKLGAADFNKKENAEAKANELNQGMAEGDDNFGKPAAMMQPSAAAAKTAQNIVQKQADQNVIGMAKFAGAVPAQGVAEGSDDTIYPNATVIKSKNGRPVGEIYQDGNSWGCFHYRADRGYDMIDSREDAIQALKALHKETGRSRPDYTIKGVAEGSDDDIWGPQGNFAGDKPVNVGDVTMKIIQVGDTVKYLGQRAKVVGMSKDRKYSRIAIESGFGGTTKDVLTADLKQLGQGVSEVSDSTKQNYKAKAQSQVKELEPHAKKGEYKDIAQRAIDRRQKGLAKVKDVAEEQLDEISKETLKSYFPKRVKAAKGIARQDFNKAERITKQDLPRALGKLKDPNYDKKDASEEQLDELKCWPGYTRVQGVPAGAPGSCKKKTNEEQHSEKCPHCGGEMVSEELINEKKDACYYKVKSRYKVWPSAYASGALVKCRKKGAKNWGSKSEGVEEGAPQPGKSSGKPISWISPEKVITKYLTLDEILNSVQGIPYYNEVVKDRDAKDFTWGVTKKVIEYARELIIRPDAYKNWPPIIVVDGKLQDGAHRISTINLMQKRVQPNNPIWKNAKLKVEFGKSDHVSQGVAEGLDEAVGGNYLYHATSPAGLKGILQSGYIGAQQTAQPATDAQTKLPSVAVTRDWNYASGSARSSEGVGQGAVIVLDRNSIESKYKTFGSSQSWMTKGLPNATADTPQMKKLAQQTRYKDANKNGKLDYNELPDNAGGAALKKDYFRPKAGGEAEEAVVVPKGNLPLQGLMIGFWVDPKSELMNDPAIMNHPMRLEMPRPNTFVKAGDNTAPATRAPVSLDQRKLNRKAGQELAKQKAIARKQGVAEGQLDEKWSQKYKSSINCSNPKGFSQKAHCAGKKKNESAILTGLKLHESK